MRVEIYGGPHDGSVIDVRPGISHLTMWTPNLDALAAGEPFEEGIVTELQLPIVDGQAIWPQEKGASR